MKNKDSFFNTLRQTTLWRFFVSVQLTVVLLFVLAGASIIGTAIPQNSAAEAYVKKYGILVFQIFHALDLIDLYHSWWFQLLLVLLTINIIVCSIDRLHQIWKIIFPEKPKVSHARFAKSPNKQEFTTPADPEQLLEPYQRQLKGFSHCLHRSHETGFFLFAEKGRWSRLGVYAVHLSVVLLLLGGLIGSIFGFEGFVNIGEGETVSQVRLMNTGEMVPLGFSVRCNDFNVKFYPSGAPEEFRSSLTIIENGKPVLSKDILVNHPLRYKGINLFQSSYGMLPPESVKLDFTSKETGLIYPIEVKVGQSVELPENLGTFTLMGFMKEYQFMGQGLGEAFVGVIQRPGSEPEEVGIPIHFPGFDKMRKGAVAVSVNEMHERYYTGLQVTKDPGVGIVFTGFGVMIIGFIITFYMSHQQVYIHVQKPSPGDVTQVLVSGTANKNKRGVELLVKRLAHKLSNITSQLA